LKMQKLEKPPTFPFGDQVPFGDPSCNQITKKKKKEKKHKN